MGNQSVAPVPTNPNASFNTDDTVRDLSLITSRCGTGLSLRSYKDIKRTESSNCLDIIDDSTTQRSRYIRRRRRSSLLLVNNGITGKFISSRICKIAGQFWKHNIETLPIPDQLEIGCSIFFAMMSTNSAMRKLLNSKSRSKETTTSTIERTSLKYLDMIGWLIRQLTTDKIDLYSLLYKLGGFHQQMGINISHFTPMLKAMHDTFAYYFEEKYNIEIKYAIDEIFSLAAQFMTGESLKCSSHLMDINEQFQGGDIPFLKSLEICLKSDIGKEYLYRYLSQKWCDEIVIFSKAMSRFTRAMSDKERFFIARDITKHSIDPVATFSLNLAYENRTNCLHNMSQLESEFATKKNINVPITFFASIEKEIFKLVTNNHWIHFCEDIQTLQLKSFDVNKK